MSSRAMRQSARSRPGRSRSSAMSSMTCSATRKPARWRSPNRSSRWRLFARAGIRGRRHRRRHLRARRLRPVRRLALSHRHATQCRPEGGRRHTSIRARSIFSPAIRQRPTASRMRSPMRASSAAPATANATAPNISPTSTAWSTARTRAKALRAAGASCIPSSASPSWRRRALRSTTPAQAVLGLKDGGGEALRARCRQRAGRAVAPRLSEVGLDGKCRSRQAVEEFTVNGFPAATATASGENWSFRLFAVRFGSDVYRFIFAAKTRTAQVDRSFRESVMTFRRMTLKESQQVKPLHLKIVTVGANDTVEKLAHRMATSDHPLDRFRVLNGLGQHDGSKAGREGSRSSWSDSALRPQRGLVLACFVVDREFARHFRSPEIEESSGL